MPRFEKGDPTAYNKLVEELTSRGARHLPTAETLYRDPRRMLAGFSRKGVSEDLWGHLKRCDVTGCDNKVCSAACHFGDRNQFLKLQQQARELLLQTGLPVWTTTIVWRKYRTKVLADFSVNAMQQALRRKFSKAEAEFGLPIFAFGGIEASYDIQLNGSASWSPHIHVMIATAIPKKILKPLLRGRKYPKHSKPVVMKDPETPERFANGFSYATKRAPAQRTRLRDAEGNKYWDKQAVEAAQRVEYDLWLLGLNNTQTLAMRD
jgi:hypothetical protein